MGKTQKTDVLARVLMVPIDAVAFICTSNSGGKRVLALFTFTINPLQGGEHADGERSLGLWTTGRQPLLQQSMTRLQVWQRSVLFTGRLLHLTFIVAPGGRELHANAIEAFNAKGPGAAPVSASSQVHSR